MYLRSVTSRCSFFTSSPSSFRMMPCNFSSPESARNILLPTPSFFPGAAAITASPSSLPFFTSFNSSPFSRRIPPSSDEPSRGAVLVILSESNWVDSLISACVAKAGSRVPGGVCPCAPIKLSGPCVLAGG